MQDAGIADNPTTMTRSRERRIATYNLHGAVGIDCKFAPERIGELLNEIDADIFALQEVPLGGAHSPDVLDVLRAA